MVNLNKIIQEELENYSDSNFNILVNEIIKRVPVLKSYNKFNNGKYSIEFQKLSDPYLNKKLYNSTELINIESINIVSEFVVSYRYFNEAKWFYFYFKNEIIMHLPKNMSNLEITIHQIVNKLMKEKYSFSKEIMLKDGKNSDPNLFNIIINELNKKTFEFDEYLQKHYHIDFY